MLPALYVAPALAQRRTTPLTVAIPSPVGLASSRYTFNGLSPEAWLGIAAGPLLIRYGFPRIHPVISDLAVL